MKSNNLLVWTWKNKNLISISNLISLRLSIIEKKFFIFSDSGDVLFVLPDAYVDVENKDYGGMANLKMRE